MAGQIAGLVGFLDAGVGGQDRQVSDADAMTAICIARLWVAAKLTMEPPTLYPAWGRR